MVFREQLASLQNDLNIRWFRFTTNRHIYSIFPERTFASISVLFVYVVDRQCNQ